MGETSHRGGPGVVRAPAELPGAGPCGPGLLTWTLTLPGPRVPTAVTAVHAQTRMGGSRKGLPRWTCVCSVSGGGGCREREHGHVVVT